MEAIFLCIYVMTLSHLKRLVTVQKKAIRSNFGNITLSKIIGSQCVLVLQLCLAACVLKLFVYVRVCASCVLYVCVALSYFI